MAETIQIIGLPELKQKLTLLEHEVYPEAGVRALNRVADTVRSRTSREIARKMGVKVADVRNSIVVERATKAQPRVQLRHRGRGMNLIRFGARQTRVGVSAKPGGQRVVVPHAFIVNLGRGNFVGVRMRKGGNQAHVPWQMVGHEQRVGRIPVIGVIGPSVPGTAAEPEFDGLRKSIVDERLPIELRSALDFYVTRLK